jgi:exonuclease SbcD
MIVAVTADLHLTERETHPERFDALDNILDQAAREGIGALIIAGDLFDEDCRNYSQFEAVCRDPRFRSIHFHIIPGNHDSRLMPRSFASENISVYADPDLRRLDQVSLPFLFLPYRKNQTMGDALAPFDGKLAAGGWVLIAHGEWVEGMREPNPLEPGVYMPLTRTDVETTQPARVILGHVHKSYDREIVHYPGSPCGFDITETGRRRFLLLDTETGLVKAKRVETGVIHFDEWMVTLPFEKEDEFIRAKLTGMMQAWKLDESEWPRVLCRLKLSGYTTDKNRLMKTVREVCRAIRFYPDGEPDLSEVSVSGDPERAEIAERVQKLIAGMDWPSGPGAPQREAAFLHALHTIYAE